MDPQSLYQGQVIYRGTKLDHRQNDVPWIKLLNYGGSSVALRPTSGRDRAGRAAATKAVKLLGRTWFADVIVFLRAEGGEKGL